MIKLSLFIMPLWCSRERNSIKTEQDRSKHHIQKDRQPLRESVDAAYLELYFDFEFYFLLYIFIVPHQGPPARPPSEQILNPYIAIKHYDHEGMLNRYNFPCYALHVVSFIYNINMWNDPLGKSSSHTDIHVEELMLQIYY